MLSSACLEKGVACIMSSMWLVLKPRHLSTVELTLPYASRIDVELSEVTAMSEARLGMI